MAMTRPNDESEDDELWFTLGVPLCPTHGSYCMAHVASWLVNNKRSTEQQITLLEAELVTLKARESAESAWKRGQFEFRSRCCFIHVPAMCCNSVSATPIAAYVPPPYMAPIAEEESKP